MPSRYERNKHTRKEINKKRKHKFLKRFITFIVIIIVCLLIWGKFCEPNILMVNDYKIVNEDIPDSFVGSKILQFSDLHYGTGYNEKRLGKLVSKINSYKPDVVVFTGDLIDKNYNASDNDLKILIKYLSKIDSKLGKYTIIGNHDFYNEDFENVMYDSGFRLLKNNYDTIYNLDNDPILLYGIDEYSYGNPRADILGKKVIDSIPYKIVIMHEGDYLDDFVNKYDVDLVLAGHSHNGQVKLPGVRPLYLPKGSKEYYSSYYKVKNTEVYISNGVGNSLFDFRLFTPPSINVFRLNNK